MSGQVAAEASPPKPPVARNLRAEMARLDVTPEALAVRVGVRERMVRRWLSDHDVNPSWANVEKLAEYFGRTPDWFYADRDPEPNPPIKTAPHR